MLESKKVTEITISQDNDNPFLKGPFRPTVTEWTSDYGDLKVIGEIPKDLNGLYIRNCHNQIHEPLGIYHPFDGDGMLAAVQFENGKVRFRNRFIQTTGYLAEKGAGKSIWPGIMAPELATRNGWGSMRTLKDNSGTDVAVHAGRLLTCMGQSSDPWRLDPVTLETFGTDMDWGRVVRDGVAPHYKVDLETGEMMFFNFPENPPYMNYGVIDRNNKLIHYTPVELPGARWPHDMGVTKNYTVLHDLPMFFDPELLKQGQHKLKFHRDIPARFGVIPRHGDGSQVRWFEGSPCYILHLSGCYEEGDEIVMDGCIMADHKAIPIDDMHTGRQAIYEGIRANLDKHNNKTIMHRWRFNLKTGETKESYLDDEVTEFPVISNDYVAKRYRYSYNVLYVPGEWLFAGVKKFDVETGATQRHEFGPGRFGSECQMARRDGAVGEDDGYLITMVTNMNEDRTEVLIFNAQEIDRGPIATVLLPERLVAGTHSCWVEADRIAGERAA